MGIGATEVITDERETVHDSQTGGSCTRLSSLREGTHRGIHEGQGCSLDPGDECRLLLPSLPKGPGFRPRPDDLAAPMAMPNTVGPNTSFQRTQTVRLFGPLNSDR